MSNVPVKSLLLSLCGASIIFAAAGDNVSIYSGGISFGGQSMMNDSLKRASNMYGTIGLNNRFALNDNFDIFADAEISGFSATTLAVYSGVNGIFGTKKVRPFVGAGAGVAWYDHGSLYEKGSGGGMSVTVHGGVELDVRDNFGITFSVPYRYTFNEFKDNSIGFQMGVLFFSPQKKIKKIM